MVKEISASKKMEEVFDLSVMEVTNALKGNKNVTDLSKIAITSIGIFAKLVSTELHENIFKFQVIKDISIDKKVFSCYCVKKVPI